MLLVPSKPAIIRKKDPGIAWRYNVSTLAETLKFTNEEMARVLQCNPDRLREDPSAPELQSQIIRLVELIWKLNCLLDKSSMDDFRSWLEFENPALGNLSPKSCLLSGKIEIVEKLASDMEAQQSV